MPYAGDHHQADAAKEYSSTPTETGDGSQPICLISTAVEQSVAESQSTGPDTFALSAPHDAESMHTVTAEQVHLVIHETPAPAHADTSSSDVVSAAWRPVLLHLSTDVEAAQTDAAQTDAAVPALPDQLQPEEEPEQVVSNTGRDLPGPAQAEQLVTSACSMAWRPPPLLLPADAEAAQTDATTAALSEAATETVTDVPAAGQALLQPIETTTATPRAATEQAMQQPNEIAAEPAKTPRGSLLQKLHLKGSPTSTDPAQPAAPQGMPEADSLLITADLIPCALTKVETHVMQSDSCSPHAQLGETAPGRADPHSPEPAPVSSPQNELQSDSVSPAANVNPNASDTHVSGAELISTFDHKPNSDRHSPTAGLGPHALGTAEPTLPGTTLVAPLASPRRSSFFSRFRSKGAPAQQPPDSQPELPSEQSLTDISPPTSSRQKGFKTLFR